MRCYDQDYDCPRSECEVIPVRTAAQDINRDKALVNYLNLLSE